MIAEKLTVARQMYDSKKYTLAARRCRADDLYRHSNRLRTQQSARASLRPRILTRRQLLC
jgi:hypothetical protein